MTQVDVRLHGVLRDYRPKDAPGSGMFQIEVEDGATISDVIVHLGLPDSWVRGIYVNGLRGDEGLALRAGDRLDLFPPAGGGSTVYRQSIGSTWRLISWIYSFRGK